MRSALDEARTPAAGLTGAAAAADRTGRALEAMRGHSMLLAVLLAAAGAAVMFVVTPSR